MNNTKTYSEHLAKLNALREEFSVLSVILPQKSAKLKRNMR